MKGKNLVKFGIIVIVGGALLGLLCAAISGAFSARTAIVGGLVAASAMLFGWVMGLLQGDDAADRRACEKAVTCISRLRMSLRQECITGANIAWNKALEAAIKALREGFRE